MGTFSCLNKYRILLKSAIAGLLLLYSLSLAAQNIRLKVHCKSTVSDSLENATIQVFSVPENRLLQTQLGNHSWNSFSLKPGHKYLIKASAVNFQEASQIIELQSIPLSVTLTLSPKDNRLATVTFLSKKPLIRQEEDKTIVDAEVLATSSTNAYEILEKTPGVVVDQDGNAYITSSTPASIYINGRLMRMSVEDLGTLLKNLPAGSVDRIEIIRSPSAKYDASNTGGIINVVLKKGIRIGSTGSLNIRYDQGVYGTTTAGFTFNHSEGRTHAHFSYQYTDRRYYDDITSNRVIGTDTLLSQISSTRYQVETHYAGAGIDIELSKKWDLAYDGRFTFNQNNSQANSNNTFIKTDSSLPYYQSGTPIDNSGHSFLMIHSLSTKYKIDSLGSEWDNEVDYTYGNSQNNRIYTDFNLLPTGNPVYGNGRAVNPSNLLDIKSDISWRLPRRFILESGFKISDAYNHNQALFYFHNGNGPLQPDPYQTNTFSYSANIRSAYFQLSKVILPYTFKAGLRLENTDILGHQFVPSDTSFSIHRNDLFPYFSIMRPLFKVFGYPLTGNALFRRNIFRPQYDELNPSPQFIDPFTYNVGNPKLQPQITTNYDINATYNNYPVFALGMNDSRNVYNQVTIQNDTTKISYRTFENLGRKKEIYARLLGGLPAGGKYFMYAGALYNHVQYVGQYDGYPLNYGRGSWTFFTGHQLKTSPSMKLNLNAYMYVNGFRYFNELKTLGQVNLSLTKTYYDNKITVVISGNDILKTMNTSFQLHQGNLLINGTRIQDTRRIGLTLRYNFGIKRAEEKKETFPPPTELERTP